MTKLLIIGSGGYIVSTVLPVLNQKYDVYIASKRSLNSINLANQYNKKFFNINLISEEIFDIYFLAIPTFEYCEILKKIPCGSKVWLEKPLAGLSLKELTELDEIICSRNLTINCGLIKRNILKFLPNQIRSFNLTLEVNKTNDWRSLVNGSEFWVDGIHGIDLAYLLNNNNFNDIQLDMSSKRWTLSKQSTDIRVVIGNTSNSLIVNNIDYSHLLNYTYSRKYFSLMFDNFSNEAGNYTDSYNMQYQFLKLLEL